MRSYKQSQNQEHNQLEEPRETVKEFDGRFFAFCDVEENIYMVEKKSFDIKVINTKDISISNFNE